MLEINIKKNILQNTDQVSYWKKIHISTIAADWLSQGFKDRKLEEHNLVVKIN